MRSSARSLFTLTAIVLSTIVLSAACSGTSALAVPLGIANLDVWLDAHDASTLFSDNAGTVAATNLGAVRNWKDKSGFNRHAVADTVLNPTRNDTELNGRPAVQLSVAGGSLDITGISIVLPYTVFVVDEYTGGGNGRTVQSETTNWLIGKHGGNNQFYNNLGFVSATETATVNVPVIGTGIADNGLNRAFHHRNGADVTQGTPAAGANPGTVDIGPSAGPGGAEVSNAAVGEVIVYGRALNAAETTLVENYLAAKHNISLNTGLGALDRYVGDQAPAGDYDYGVFGIGRVNAGAIVTSTSSDGLAIAEDNSSLDNNNEWLLAGHKTANNQIIPIEFTDPDVTGNRWSRLWYLDKTGAVGATLSFDFEDAGLVLPNGASKFQLLYSADESFANGYDILAETSLISSGTVTFNVSDLDLIDGYYTLGINIGSIPEPGTWTMLGLGSLALAWRTRRRNHRRSGIA